MDEHQHQLLYLLSKAGADGILRYFVAFPITTTPGEDMPLQPLNLSISVPAGHARSPNGDAEQGG